MSKEIRQMIDKVKNFKQFVNENIESGYIIKKKFDDEYVTYNDDLTSRYGGYAITQDRNNAKLFKTKKDAIDAIIKNNLELHLMTDFEVEKF